MKVSTFEQKYRPKPKLPIKKLLKWFIFAKLTLLTIVIVTPKQYDTSSHVLMSECPRDKFLSRLLCRVTERLVIWDSVYFTSVAQRGIWYEQEWAFGRFWSGLIAVVGQLIWTNSEPRFSLSSPPLFIYGITGIILANLFHFLACISLYYLTVEVFNNDRGRDRIAQSCALLFTISPGGIFLMAGYTESLFAFLTFYGLYLREKKRLFFSGIVFAINCGVRSNGILYGIYFAYDFVLAIRTADVPKLYGSFLGGAILGISFFALQLWPYWIYCVSISDSSLIRPWCHSYIPSIYSFVQKEYWNVGFLRYWTPNNIPNFLFAFPTLCLLSMSLPLLTSLELWPYVAVQSITLVGSVFLWHVQIVTRIATSLPAIYWYTAILTSSTKLLDIKLGKRIVRYFIVWSIVQGVLFSAFLPPA